MAFRFSFWRMAALMAVLALVPLPAGAQGTPDTAVEDDAANMDAMEIPVEPDMTEPELAPTAIPESLLLPLGGEGEPLDGGEEPTGDGEPDEPPAN